MRKSLGILLVLAGMSLPSYATSINVGGAIAADVTWSADTVNVSSDLTVNNNVTLTISPGTRVEFQGHYKLNVQGRLLAVGTVADGIVFTAADTSSGWHGIRFVNTAVTNDTSLISFCRIEYGRATGLEHGAGICIENFSKVRISGCHVVRNNGGSRGGGIGLLSASPVIENCIIEYNTASNGGGIYCDDGSQPLISGDTVRYNSASYSGGGIGCQTRSHPRITGCVITDNAADDIGGGISINYNSDPVVTGNTIARNTADEGAGIITDGSRPRIINNVITDNVAVSRAGGIYIFDSSYPLIMGNLIARNSARYGGGAYFYYHGRSILVNNTIVDNIAYYDLGGGGLYVILATVQVYNTVFYGNTNGLYRTYGSDAHLTMTNSLTTPLFVDAAGGDYRLQHASPCVDGGTMDTTGLGLSPYDLDGNPRIYGGSVARVDIGAYEYQGDPAADAVPEFFLPLGDEQIVTDTLYQRTARAYGYPVPAFALLGAPAGMTIDDSTGIINWVPADSQADTHNVRVSVVNSAGADTLEYVLTVLVDNYPPVITSATIDTAVENETFIYIATARDPDDHPVLSFENIPSWMTVVNGDLIKGTPLPGTSDTSFTVIAADGEFSDTVTVQLHIERNTGIDRVIGGKLPDAGLKYFVPGRVFDIHGRKLNDSRAAGRNTGIIIYVTDDGELIKKIGLE